MRYENRYLAPNIDILSNTIRRSKEISLFTASKNAWKSRLSHFQLLSKSALTLSNHEPRSLWRWGSTRNRRINRFPATVLALLLYICLWRWKLAAPEQLSAWTIRHDHVIIAERIFSSWVAYNLSLRSQVDFPHYMSERERRRCVQFYVNKTGCSPSLSQILQACVMQCEQWET